MKRYLMISAAVPLVIGCASTAAHPSTLPDPVTGERRPMPTAIPCDSAVVVNASNSAQGVAAERRWIRKYYPGSTVYGQALRGHGGRMYDVMKFKDRDGREISICFDITSWFGRW